MLHMLWVHLKCSLLSFSRFKTLGSSHSWSFPPCYVSAFFGDPTPTSTVTSSSDSTHWYTSTAQSGPLLLKQHLHPTLAFKPLILFPTTLYLLSLHLHHRLMLLAASSSPPILSELFNGVLGGLRARSTELVHFISSHPVDPICIQESNLNISSSFEFLDSLLCDPMTPTSDLVFFTDATDASGSVIIFFGQGLSFSELSTSSLDPYSDYVGVNISLNESSSLSFLNVYAPPIRFFPKDSTTSFFSPSIFPSYVEAVEFSRFYRKRTASTFRIPVHACAKFEASREIR